MRKLSVLVVLAALGVALWLLAADDTAAPTPVAREAPPPDEPVFDEGGARISLARAAAMDGPETLARPGCVTDVLALDGTPGLDAVRAAFFRGLPGEDAALATYLGELVAERIGADPALALEVVAWAERAPLHEAQILLQGLAASEGAKDPRVARRLLALGQDAAKDERLRAFAVDALRTQPRLDEEGRGALARLGLDEASPGVAWSATRALGQAMGSSYAATGEFEPYWDELEKIARGSEEAAVRAVALEAPMAADTILPASKIEKLVELMDREPHRDVRELAVFQLGLTSSPDEALAAMRRAFLAEYDTCVRWAIVRFAVRAAGARAMPLLEEFARIDPVFVADVEDYRALFAQGYVDYEQIWLQKPERHMCSIEDGEPHGGEL